jgi:phenylacetate-CoA ligase
MIWPNEISGASAQRTVDAHAFLTLEHSGFDTITQWQQQRLIALLEWLIKQVPWWRDRLGTGIDILRWHELPILSRLELRKMVALQGAASVPAEHGTITSMPPNAMQTAASRGFYLSEFAQRLISHAYYADHQRQGRNPYATHACIADDVPLHDGDHVIIPPSQIHGCGVQALRNLDLFSKAQHIKWLSHHKPSYLTVQPDWFEVALVHAFARRDALPEIRQILSYGATATDSLRRKARQWLGATVRHRYSCPECGPLAFQCPRSDAYLHVAVGNALLEVVEESGQVKPPATSTESPSTGRILVTALHQYATPLIRYDTGDTGALHAGCPGCGLDVPALSVLRQNV